MVAQKLKNFTENRQDIAGFTRLGLQGQFRSWLDSFKCISGNYGYKLILHCKEEVVKTEITSNFGPRIHPITGESSVHTGVDIADGSSPGTTNIIAAKEGTVIYPTNSDRRDCP